MSTGMQRAAWMRVALVDLGKLGTVGCTERVGLTPAGLADGLALSSERYRRITAGFAPEKVGSPLPESAPQGLGTAYNNDTKPRLRT